MFARFLFSLPLFVLSASAAVVLSVDVNDALDTPADTAPGFGRYLLSDDTFAFGLLSVDLNPAGGATLDDVHRAAPLSAGALTLGALYRDSVFAAADNTANFARVGLDLTISGLTVGKKYTLTAWSYDSGSAGARVSDWSVLGLGGPVFAANNYSFDGAAAPAADTASRFSVSAYADAAGTLTLRGRPNAASTLAQVFLNGFTLDESAAAAQQPATVLALDFNDRAGAGTTLAGFQEFLLSGTEGTAQSTSARTFGALSVTLSAVGSTLDDRLRATPLNAAPFSDSLLLRDFVFATGTSGLDARVHGLSAGATYLVELWSFDSGSPGARPSNWTVNAATLWSEYTFNGSIAPLTNNDGKMSGAFVADASGDLLLSGRFVSGTAPTVFLNALRISLLAPAAIVDLGRPIISEFLADNSSGITDEDGATSDWIEIWNTTANTLDLGNWSLTDDAALRSKWVFPAGVTVASQARLRIWASGKDRKANPAALHANFSLNKAAGTYLALFPPTGAAATEFSGLPSQRADISFGLVGSAEPLTAGYFQTPTPLAPNGAQVPGFVSDTVFDFKRGFYSGALNVHISCATPGALIYYTLDGSEPTASSTAYPGAAGIPVSTTTVLRARAFLAPLAPSNTDTQTYLFRAHVQNQPAAPAGWPATWGTDSEVASNNGGNGAVPADYAMDPRVAAKTLPGLGIPEALAALPSLSVTLDPALFHSVASGIYTNPKSIGVAWERAASMEWLWQDGTNFHSGVGLRVHGNSSRRPFRMQKHSFTLSFKNEYGNGKLNEKLFEDTTVKDFNKLVLHCFFTDGWGMVSWDQPRYRPDDSLYFRDPWMRRSMAAMGYPTASGRYVHLYINSLYWGLYEISERIDETFCADHLGGIPADWDVMTDFSVGNTPAASSAWSALFSFLNNNDLSVQANYQAVAAQIDLVNFADYYLLHVHGDSEDWPHHNGYAIRNHSVAGSKWRFLVWDQEIVFDPTLSVDRLSTGAANTTTDLTAGRLFAKLKSNPEFRLLLADRAHRQLDNNGALSLAAEKARWQALADILDKPIVAESARWGDTAEATPYGNAVPAGRYFSRETDWLPSVAAVRDTHFARLHDASLAVSTVAKLRAQSPALYPLTNPPALSLHGGTVQPGYALSITAPAGTIYYTLDGSDPREAFSGNAVGNIFSGPVSLVKSTLVRARAKNGAEWSALTEASFVTGIPATAANLVLSELLYKPALSPDHEYLELLNTSATDTLALTGVRFTAGITFDFPDGFALAPGQRVLVVRDAAAFSAQFGNGLLVAGAFSGALDNSGEEMALSDAAGADIFRFKFEVTAPWPVEGTAPGRSLVLIGASSHPNPALPENWRASSAVGGSPGAADGSVFSGNVSADADRDGLNSLTEYALGSNPNNGASGPSAFVAGRDAEGRATMTFPHNLLAGDVVCMAESSTDLSTWTPAEFVGRAGETSSVLETWRSAGPPALNIFMRLRLKLAP